MPFDLESALNIGVGALVGLAVGIEREWSGRARASDAQFAGVRTFFVLGLLAGVSGWFLATGREAVAIVMLAGAVLLTLVGYALAARTEGEGVHGTTEAAALLVLALAAAAGMGHLQLAAGATAVTLLALCEKSRIHAAVQKIGRHELLAALQFAVLALVILPLLPAGPYGPLGGIRPRALWMVVPLFSGLNFAGYLARRAVGEAALTLAMARLGRQPEMLVTAAKAIGIKAQDSSRLGPGALSLMSCVLAPVRTPNSRRWWEAGATDPDRSA